VVRISALAAFAAGLACAAPALAEDCLNPNALGTARTIAVDPATFGRIGTMQYRDTLPLAPKEIVLTFDDGPMPPMTNKVLETLRNECVKATFFLIGRNAKAHAALTREIARDGHTIANHTQNHHLQTMGEALGAQEMDVGFRSIAAALEPDGRQPAPFFRFPGLLNTAAIEAQAKKRGVAVMSADLLADDWTGISADAILQRGLARLGQKGSGIFLLHDVQPATALMLPKLLAELKKRGYRIVHMVPAGGAPAFSPEPLVAEKPLPAPPRRTAARKRTQVADLSSVVPGEEPLQAHVPATKTAFGERWRKYMASHPAKPRDLASP
jgi:peptidoglycan/xylan/chitin deacetylase (PgdA/CDA1 family)